MKITQSKIILSKADADRIFAMTRSEWESYAKGSIYPEGWKVRLDPSDSGSGVLGHHPPTGIELTIRLYYDNAIDPPEVLFVISHYPPARLRNSLSSLKAIWNMKRKVIWGPNTLFRSHIRNRPLLRKLN